MSLIPSAADHPTGLHQRYIVTKANGEPCDPDAVYLVLRLDYGGDDQKWIASCREAALALVGELDSINHMPGFQIDLMRLLRLTQKKFSE